MQKYLEKNSIWSCLMMVFVAIKVALFCSCVYKNIQLICLIFVKVLTKIKRNSIGRLSKLLACVLFYFGRSSSWWVFIQDLHLNFHSFLGFRHGSGSSVKAIMPLSATLPLAIGLKCFWFLIALLLYTQSQPYLDYLFSILKIFAYQTSFQEDLDKNVLSVHT